MARIARKPQKIFAQNANNNGVFGSAQDGTKVLSNDIVTLQSLSAYLTGWNDAIIDGKKFPTLEEFQALNFINTYQLSYLFQEGIPEFEIATTYYQNSIVRKPGTYELYGSLINDNIGNALPSAEDDDNWKFLLDLSINDRVPYGICTGVANAYSITTDPLFDSLVDGSIFLAQINVNNTGATTLNPNSIGSLPVFSGNAALKGGELLAGTDYLFAVDQTNNLLQLLTPSPLSASTTQKGIVQIATPLEMITQTDQQKAATPYNINQLFSEANRASLTDPGFQILPGGLMMQWGVSPTISDGSSTVIDLPKPYSTLLCAMATLRVAMSSDASNTRSCSAVPVSNTQLRLYYNASFGSSATLFWFTIGIV